MIRGKEPRFRKTTNAPGMNGAGKEVIHGRV
jgi:hypothetical protein